jgi:hypothetical protein
MTVSRRRFLGGLLAAVATPVMPASATQLVVPKKMTAVAGAVAYHMQAVRQDEFCEAFYPTTIFSPDSIGYSVQLSGEFRNHADHCSQ